MSSPVYDGDAGAVDDGLFSPLQNLPEVANNDDIVAVRGVKIHAAVGPRSGPEVDALQVRKVLYRVEGSQFTGDSLRLLKSVEDGGAFKAAARSRHVLFLEFESAASAAEFVQKALVLRPRVGGGWAKIAADVKNAVSFEVAGPGPGPRKVLENVKAARAKRLKTVA